MYNGARLDDPAKVAPPRRRRAGVARDTGPTRAGRRPPLDLATITTPLLVARRRCAGTARAARQRVTRLLAPPRTRPAHRQPREWRAHLLATVAPAGRSEERTRSSPRCWTSCATYPAPGGARWRARARPECRRSSPRCGTRLRLGCSSLVSTNHRVRRRAGRHHAGGARPRDVLSRPTRRPPRRCAPFPPTEGV